MIRSALSRKFTIGAVSALAAAMLAGGTTAAHASTQPANPGATPTPVPLSNVTDCKNADPTHSYLCWWVGPGETGKMHPVRDEILNWTTQKESTCGGGTWNDCASTLYNDNSVYDAWVFSNSSWGGYQYCVPSGTLLFNLAGYVYEYDQNHQPSDSQGMDNTISSNQWMGCGL